MTHKKLVQYKEIGILFILVIIFFWKIFIYYDRMIYPSLDVTSQYSFWRWFFASNVIRYSEIPLWNPYVFSGAPFVGNTLSGMFYPINVLFIIFPTNLLFGYIFILDIFLIGLFTYIFARIISLNKFSSLISAITFAFSGTIITRIYAGHLSNLDAIVWFPLVLVFYELAVAKKDLFYGMLAGFPLALMFLTGNFHFAAYGFVGSLLYFIFRSLFIIKEGRNFKDTQKLVLILIISLFVFFSLFAVQFLPSLEFSRFSNRGSGVSYEFSTEYSLSPEHFITFIIPEFFGSPVNNTYHGSGNIWELCGYVGVLPLLLGILGLTFKRNKYTTVFIILIVFTLLFSLGKYTPFFSIFYYYIPGFNMFRIPATFLYIYAFSVSILGGFGSDFLIEPISHKDKPKLNKIINILIFISILTVVTALIFYFGKDYIILFGESIAFERYYSYSFNTYSIEYYSIYIFIILLISNVFILTLRSKNRINLNHLKILLILLIFSDLLIFGSKYIDTKDSANIFKPPEFINIIASTDSDLYRVDDRSGLLGQEIASKYGIELASGYDPTYLKLYQDFFWLAGEHGNSKYWFSSTSNISNLDIFRLLNIKYIITDNELDVLGLNKIYHKNNTFIYEIENTLPRAFIIPNAKIIEEKKDVLNVLKNKEINITEQIILEKNPNVPFNNTGEFKKLNVYRRSANRIEILANISNPGFLVLSEIWYPGWKAYDNAQEIEIYRTNYALRSVYLRKNGEHRVILSYEPASYKVGKIITIFSIMIYAIVIIYLRRFKWL